MSAVLIRSAQDFSLTALRRAMNDAFSDYALPMQLKPDAFELMMRMRGLSRAASRVAIVGDVLAAFWLVGVEDRRAYLISSGTIPRFRRQGLSRQLGTTVRDALTANGYQTLQSEVLSDNAKARALYRQLGFAEGRDLDSYILPAVPSTAPPAGIQITVGSCLPDDAQDMWDVAPSWQNSLEAVRAAGAQATVLHGHVNAVPVAYAAFVPSQGALAQCAVRTGFRRQGLARLLVAQGQKTLGLKTLRVINVDRTGRRVAAFLDASGATRIVSQKELRLSL